MTCCVLRSQTQNDSFNIFIRSLNLGVVSCFPNTNSHSNTTTITLSLTSFTFYCLLLNWVKMQVTYRKRLLLPHKKKKILTRLYIGKKKNTQWTFCFKTGSFIVCQKLEIEIAFSAMYISISMPLEALHTHPMLNVSKDLCALHNYSALPVVMKDMPRSTIHFIQSNLTTI